MLETLYIKNFAIINELEINFYRGLNVLSGETGAGKSIITGADACEVSMLISVDDNSLIEKLSEQDIEVDDDNYILVKRTFNNNGKSNCRINGRPVTVSMVRQLASMFFDIHSQHDNHKLLNSKKHIEILDKLCPDTINDYKHQLYEKISEYNSIQKIIKELDTEDKDIQGKIDLYNYQIDEISSANLKINEEEELNNRKAVLINSVKLQDCCDSILDKLYRKEDNAAVDSIYDAIDNLNTINSIDNTVNDLLEELNNACSIIEDVVNTVRSYSDKIDCEPEELDYVEDRLTLIYNLKKKYGNTIENILSYMEDTKDKLNQILNSEELVAEYKVKLETVYKDINKICSKISDIRKQVAFEFSKKIQNNLYDLSMESAKFDISINNQDSFSSNGYDKVEFLISANKGEPMKALSRVASGGEMSRVMLALKTVLADSDNIDTFIFDEIDTGISGRTAQKVAEKLKLIADNHQILCITHLPQIAAMADKNYLIQKSVNNEKTETSVIELDGEQVYSELARLIGGATITESTLLAAREMKELADKQKGN